MKKYQARLDPTLICNCQHKWPDEPERQCHVASTGDCFVVEPTDKTDMSAREVVFYCREHGGPDETRRSAAAVAEALNYAHG